MRCLDSALADDRARAFEAQSFNDRERILNEKRPFGLEVLIPIVEDPALKRTGSMGLNDH